MQERKLVVKKRMNRLLPKDRMKHEWIFTIALVILLIAFAGCTSLRSEESGGSASAGRYEIVTLKPFKFYTAHVQGLAFSAGYLFLSAVDREERTGYLLKIDPNTFSLIESRKLKIGDMYHAGGISGSNGYLYLPLAEYRPEGRSVVLKIDPHSMKVIESFPVNDHIGAVASDGKNHIFGMNWDARYIYIWDKKGMLLKKLKNRRATAYQDIEYRNGKLYCSGIIKWPFMTGVIDIYLFDANSITLEFKETRRLPWLGAFHSIAKEGMTISDGYFYFAPEDFPDTRIYRIRRDE